MIVFYVALEEGRPDAFAFDGCPVLLSLFEDSLAISPRVLCTLIVD